MRTVDDLNLLARFTTDFCKIVEKHCPYVLVSGFLAISSGRSRGTEDIDMIIPKIPLKTFKALHKDLLRKYSLFHLEGLPLEEVYEYLQEANVRYVSKGQLIPNMEVKFAKNAVDEDNLRKRKKIALTGLDVYFAPIECAIAYKEHMGSQKDIEDARHLRKVYEDEIDAAELKRYARMIAREL